VFVTVFINSDPGLGVAVLTIGWVTELEAGSLAALPAAPSTPWL
jgi:hypothetical protein